MTRRFELVDNWKDVAGGERSSAGQLYGEMVRLGHRQPPGTQPRIRLLEVINALQKGVNGLIDGCGYPFRFEGTKVDRALSSPSAFYTAVDLERQRRWPKKAC